MTTRARILRPTACQFDAINDEQRRYADERLRPVVTGLALAGVFVVAVGAAFAWWTNLGADRADDRTGANGGERGRTEPVAPAADESAVLRAGGSVLTYGEGWQCVVSVGGTQYRANGATEDEARRNAIEAWRLAR